MTGNKLWAIVFAFAWLLLMGFLLGSPMGITILLIKKYFTENVQAIIGMPLILAENYLLGRFALPSVVHHK